MATRLFLRSTFTYPRAKRGLFPGYLDYRDMIAGVQGVGASNMLQNGSDTGIEKVLGAPNRTAFWSERIPAGGATISGTIPVHIWMLGGTTGIRPRVKLSKITAGGGDVITDLAIGDGTVDLTTSQAAYDFNIVLPAAVDLAAGERLIVRVFIFRPDGTNVTGGTLSYNGASGVQGDSWIELPQTIAFKKNTTQLSLRQTVVNGLSGFMDLLEAFDTAAAVTAVVTTTASGTEIQWTKTAGGVLAAWISPRFKSQWEFPSNVTDGRAMSIETIWAKESVATVNATLKTKTWIRKPDGTEIGPIYTNNATLAGELTTTMAGYTDATADTYTQPTNVGEDDRLILRVYVVNSGTMGSGTATLQYDGPMPTTNISFMDMPDFKAESDPAKQPVPSGVSMSGLGNGQ